MKFLILISIILIFFQLGNFIDITTKAKQSDIIVILGGGRGCRLQKGIEMYQKKMSRSQKLIYTGSDKISTQFIQSGSRSIYLSKHGINIDNIVHINGAINTMEELFYIKKYILKQGYTSVLLISHPYHSRRIISLANYIAKYNNANIEINVIGCDLKWWNKTYYYINKKSFIATISETIKLIYNLIKYSPLFISFTSLAYKQQHHITDKTINKLN